MATVIVRVPAAEQAGAFREVATEAMVVMLPAAALTVVARQVVAVVPAATMAVVAAPALPEAVTQPVVVAVVAVPVSALMVPLSTLQVAVQPLEIPVMATGTELVVVVAAV